MADSEEHRRALGRPRNEEVGPAILAVTRRLVMEHGYDAVTTRMIADAAGSGKQTIYRRWPSKAELVLDAFLAHAKAQVDRPMRRPAPVREQISDFLQRTFAALSETGPAIRGLMATAQQDSEFRVAFRTRFIEPRRAAFKTLLSAAIDDGLLPSGADIEIATIALYGTVWYRILLDEPMDDAYPQRLADLIVGGLKRPGHDV